MIRASALFAGIFALALLQSVVLGAIANDESWYLQVAARVSEGDVLYRDVYFNTTPLAPALAAALVEVFGAHVLVVKALAAAAVALQGTMIAIVARELGARWAVAAALAAGVLIAGTGVGSVYSELSVALAAAALACALGWRRRGDPRLAAAAGAAASLSLMAKHSTGALAVVAVLVALDRRALRPALGGAAVVAVVALGVVVALGGGPKLLEYGFTAKGTYLDAAGTSYFAQLGDAARTVGDAVRSPTDYDRVSAAVNAAQFALPLLALAALVAALARAPREGRRTVLTVAAFAAAAAVNLYPVGDAAHMGYATPLLLLAFWFGARTVVPPRVVTGAALVLLLVPLVVVVRGTAVLTSDEYAALDVPRFEHVVVRPEDVADYLRTARGIAAVADEGPLFVLDNGAGFYYLSTGVKNPTPFDFPAVTALGRDGEATVARAFATGRIRTVCVGEPGFRAELRPRRLQAAIRRVGRRGADLGRCTLFRAP